MLRRENYDLHMKNKELTTMLEKTRCRFVMPDDGRDYELEILRKQIGLLRNKYHGVMGLVKNQKEYYDKLIAYLATEDVL